MNGPLKLLISSAAKYFADILIFSPKLSISWRRCDAVDAQTTFSSQSDTL